MPELPEVETVVRDLRPHLVGRRLSAFRVSKFPLRRKWSHKWNALLLGRRVQEINRRGKWIVVRLDSPNVLVLHLGMTGQLTVVDAATPLADHVHLVANLDDGARQLRFRDVRRFGSAELFASAGEVDNHFEQSGLGPEPFALDAAYFRECLQGTKRCLKAILLDQRVVAGVGNIYADESLFAAKLPPTRLGEAIAPTEADRLRKAIVQVLTTAIEKRGSSIRDYVGGSGLKGEYQKEFRVYGCTGQPCPRCKTPIARMRLAGRSTHYCPKCQRS